MKKNNFPKLVGLIVVSLSTCFAVSCATGLRDAVMAGVFDFTTNTVTDTLGSFISVSTLLGGA